MASDAAPQQVQRGDGYAASRRAESTKVETPALPAETKTRQEAHLCHACRRTMQLWR